MYLENAFTKDLHKLIEEINLYPNDHALWKIKEGIHNSGGNLTLHLIGNLNYYIGTALSHTNYVRNREEEFTLKNISKDNLITEIKHVIELIKRTFHKSSHEDIQLNFPFPIENGIVTIENVLIRLLSHLNYHLGQINYHRRMIAFN